MKFFLFFTYLLNLVLTPSYAAKQDEAPALDTTAVTTTTKTQENMPYLYGINKVSQYDGRFQPYGLNSAVWQYTESDEAALEGNFSFRYTLVDCSRGKEVNEQGEVWRPCKRQTKSELAVFFSYTGEFDFYLSTRDSSPVVNRVSNPALHFYTIFNTRHFDIDFFDIALQHRSDGQATEIDEINEEGELKTQIAYQNGDHQYFDSLSRGSNYISFALGSDDNSRLNWQISYKAYVDHDTEINWGPLANKNITIKDYDLVRLRSSYKIPTNSSFFKPVINAEYTFGKKFTDTDSLDITLVAPIELGRFSFPFLIKAHFGPMETLSNYTKSVTSIGFGLAFSL